MGHVAKAYRAKKRVEGATNLALEDVIVTIVAEWGTLQKPIEPKKGWKEQPT